MAYTHLGAQEREELSRGLAVGESLREIGRRLGRSHTTLSRERTRNGAENPHAYRALTGQQHAIRSAKVPRRSRTLFTDPWLWAYVTEKLRADWSPEQIAASLRTTYPQEMRKRISPEAIYAALYVLPRGTLKAELLSHLRHRHRRRRKRGLLHDRRGQIPHMVSIHERPAEVAERLIPGHWEGDLLVGRRNQSALGVLVERTTRLTLLAAPKSREATDVRAAFVRAFRSLPPTLRKTLTYDRGKEMAEHERLAAAAGIRVFFCDPQAPYQRGMGENTNGLLRQYFPKGTDFTRVTPRDLRFVMGRLNTRPRKVLDFATPLEVWKKHLRGALLT